MMLQVLAGEVIEDWVEGFDFYLILDVRGFVWWAEVVL